jgi:hypothetical protein
VVGVALILVRYARDRIPFSGPCWSSKVGWSCYREGLHLGSSAKQQVIMSGFLKWGLVVWIVLLTYPKLATALDRVTILHDAFGKQASLEQDWAIRP